MFIQTVLYRADNVTNKLLLAMCKRNTGDNKNLLEEYKELAGKAMKTPADTEELIELDEYITKQKDTGIKELESRLQDSVKRVKFLVRCDRLECDLISAHKYCFL